MILKDTVIIVFFNIEILPHKCIMYFFFQFLLCVALAVFALTILHPDLLPKYPEQIYDDVDNYSYENPEWVQRRWTSGMSFIVYQCF